MSTHLTPAEDLDVSVLQETIKILMHKHCEGIHTSAGTKGQTVIREASTGRRFLVELHELK